MTPRSARKWAIWLGLYLLVMLGVWRGLDSARRNVLESLDTAEARAQWQQWREDVAAERERGSARRVPGSNEPPALVLLRDHYGTCLTAALLLSTALFWVTAFFVQGALATPASKSEAPSDNREQDEA